MWRRRCVGVTPRCRRGRCPGRRCRGSSWQGSHCRRAGLVFGGQADPRRPSVIAVERCSSERDDVAGTRGRPADGIVRRATVGVVCTAISQRIPAGAVGTDEIPLIVAPAVPGGGRSRSDRCRRSHSVRRDGPADHADGPIKAPVGNPAPAIGNGGMPAALVPMRLPCTTLPTRRRSEMQDAVRAVAGDEVAGPGALCRRRGCWRCRRWRQTAAVRRCPGPRAGDVGTDVVALDDVARGRRSRNPHRG